MRKGNNRTMLVLLAIVALLAVALFGLLQLLEVLLVRNADPAATQESLSADDLDTLPADAAAIETGENLHTVVFPAWQEGRDESNAAVYDTAPFTVTLALPQGWLVVLPPVEDRAPGAPWTAVQLVNASGTLCGEMGFEPAEQAAISLEDPLRLEYPAADVYAPALGVRVQLRMDPAAITQDGLAALAESVTVQPVA